MPIDMVRRADPGHERSSTTRDAYTRGADHSPRLLDPLGDPDDEGTAGLLAPLR
ncbi:hypothetical protein FHR81_003163 [Actinoalloteichus hoggarensis]|uniref:hypothetical protein n=1 Tax=Actinoalloteichus hoggarensis TaxID=1470176 RepID=UPI0012FE7935|nr:hypothetical protein [Actinoalloteichus hoggarensis]MBB5922111.1 hypothetical protein [Actinoalloteichus hoggarensis]